ncbi:MAG: hypothetical protein A3K19_26225 [Lentisphaerae bacterium RIFOXYB12_FULL_65_16]|nr:MAG: hypothetical protein A3K18_29690 [Lentisphaerae bacterium RIFOXYA12_64_32]OGV87772.1 MAG: hypothetical protein A3K19_26225 [Lentisphaerae bacterium RIFOXYB12_FULL_65_16]
MKRLVQPLIPLYCETGASIDDAWMTELAWLDIRPRPRRGAIPFHADLRWWFCEKHHHGTLLEAVNGVDLSKIFPNGVQAPAPRQPLPAVPGLAVEECWSGAPVVYARGGYPGSVHTIAVRTPEGTLSATEQYADRCFGVTEYAVKTVDDLRLVRAIYQCRADAARQTADAELPGGLPMVAFQSFLIQWAGVMQAVYMYADAPAEVDTTVDFVERQYEPLIRRLARRQPWIGSCENLASDVSAPYWESHVGPQLARRAALAAEGGAKWDIHLDGKVMPLLGKLRTVGISGVNGLTASPSGDLDPLRFRDAAGSGIRLKDILPQIVFVPDACSDAAFEDYVRNVIEFYKTDGNIVLGIGDMLPVNGSLARVERVIDLIEALT